MIGYKCRAVKVLMTFGLMSEFQELMEIKMAKSRNNFSLEVVVVACPVLGRL